MGFFRENRAAATLRSRQQQLAKRRLATKSELEIQP